MKFGQLVEYKMRAIFLEKSFSNCGGEIIPISSSQKLKLSISLDQWSKISYSLLLLYAKWRAIKLY